MNAEDYRKKIEQDVLKLMEEKLREGKMTAVRAREIAQYILKTLRPDMDIAQIQKAVVNFDKNFKELLPVVTSVTLEYEQRMNTIISGHLGKLLKQNKVHEAADTIKKLKR